ncbi:antibiotic biosynthesis monooxygenase family protein [Novosphingobium sp. RL4]|uniref:antibiotic biosynthesis monooxygenase family protein n=1 Tax=Novosphingobium sp. RL4 TaxID=3109595 RepID=UPI002D7842D9|nr:antibiotic biosynthesis monooxygenase family protein [Novosphingobium sp. RL4]WRT94410.1 antibiotic biosynthesis monooxygenase family protein [Novosphingobium sp. RL4]
MLERKELDRVVTMREQLGDTNPESVVLINTFNVDAGDVDELIAAWEADAAYFKRQPGFISTQLHRGIAGSCTFLNYAVWQDINTFRAAFLNPEFQEKLAAYPSSTSASPHLFRKMAVPNICVS